MSGFLLQVLLYRGKWGTFAHGAHSVIAVYKKTDDRLGVSLHELFAIIILHNLLYNSTTCVLPKVSKIKKIVFL